MKKIKLKTIEDFTKALKDDKTVYAMNEFCDGKSELKLLNNILIRKDADGEIIIGGHIIFKENVFYIEEKEPVKLEVGKFYKTRDGKKVCCFYKYKSNVYDFNWAFIKVNEQPDIAIFKSRDNGRQWESENAYHGDDIVDYWEE